MAKQDERRRTSRRAPERKAVARPSRGGGRHESGDRAPGDAESTAGVQEYSPGERATDAGTYLNMEPEGLRDKGYEALEADAGDEREIRGEADEFAGVSADEPLDEDVERASPTEMMVELPSGDLLEEEIATPPETEHEPPSNIDQPIVRAPDSAQPETQGRAPGDEDIEGNWPDEGYYDQDDTLEREG